MREALMTGSRSGTLARSTGVGTATTMYLHSRSCFRVGREADVGILEVAAEGFAGAIDSLLKFLDAARVDVKADHGDVSGERHGQRQADIAKSDNRNRTLNILHRCLRTTP